MKHTGRDYDTIEKALDRDNFMDADEAKEFGLIDEGPEANLSRPQPDLDRAVAAWRPRRVL